MSWVIKCQCREPDHDLMVYTNDPVMPTDSWLNEFEMQTREPTKFESKAEATFVMKGVMAQEDDEEDYRYWIEEVGS